MVSLQIWMNFRKDSFFASSTCFLNRIQHSSFKELPLSAILQCFAMQCAKACYLESLPTQSVVRPFGDYFRFCASFAGGKLSVHCSGEVFGLALCVRFFSCIFLNQFIFLQLFVWEKFRQCFWSCFVKSFGKFWDIVSSISMIHFSNSLVMITNSSLNLFEDSSSNTLDHNFHNSFWEFLRLFPLEFIQ